MKKEDLMVGDYVAYKNNYPDSHLQGMIGIVSEIAEKINIYATDGNYYSVDSADDLQPIPLTKEIIEKNLSWEVKQGYIQYSPYKESKFSFNGYMCMNSTVIEAPFEFVHELQHMLRICDWKGTFII